MSDQLMFPFARRPRLIAFTGKMTSGKTTAAERLVHGFDFRRVSFATPLKQMLQALGLTSDELLLKHVPCDLLGGKTPREALQTLGTEWGRKMIDEDIWVRATRRRVEELLANDTRVVIDDCRFSNEAKLVRDLGGVIYEISRPELSFEGMPVAQHASEAGFSHTLVDGLIFNVGTVPELYAQIDSLV